MSSRSLALRIVALIGCAASACADADTQPPTSSTTSSSSSGTGGGGAPAACGNGTIDPGEECDTDDFGTATCADYERPNGSLGCDSYCQITDIGCFREEKCDAVGGVDRDGDGLFGCSDEDCFDHPVCATPCEVVLYAEKLDASAPGSFTVLYLPSGHGAEPDAMQASCAPGVTGGDRIYALKPAVTGTLRIEADTTLDGMDLSLSLRTVCAEGASEIACEHVPGAIVPETLAVHVEADTTYYLIVDGFVANTIPSMMLWMGLDPDGAGGSGGSSATGGAGGAGGMQ